MAIWGAHDGQIFPPGGRRCCFLLHIPAAPVADPAALAAAAPPADGLAVCPHGAALVTALLAAVAAAAGALSQAAAALA